MYQGVFRGFIDVRRSLIDISWLWFPLYFSWSLFQMGSYWAFSVLRVCDKAEKWWKKGPLLDLVKSKLLRLYSVSWRGLTVTL